MGNVIKLKPVRENTKHQEPDRLKNIGKFLRFPVFYPRLPNCEWITGRPPTETGTYTPPAPYGEKGFPEG